MSKFQRLCAMGLTAALTVGMLAGCGNQGAGGSENSITLVISARDEWLSTLADAATEAGKAQGYEVIVQDCQNDVNKQIQYVETVRNSGADTVIVNLVNYELAEEVIRAAGDSRVD